MSIERTTPVPDIRRGGSRFASPVGAEIQSANKLERVNTGDAKVVTYVGDVSVRTYSSWLRLLGCYDAAMLDIGKGVRDKKGITSNLFNFFVV